MDASEKWMIIRFTPYQTTLPKRMFFQKLIFKSSLLLNGFCGIQGRPPNSSNDRCLPFCLIFLLLYAVHIYCKRWEMCGCCAGVSAGRAGRVLHCGDEVGGVRAHPPPPHPLLLLLRRRAPRPRHPLQEALLLLPHQVWRGYRGQLR